MSYILITDFAPFYVLRRVGAIRSAEMAAMTQDMLTHIENSPEKTVWVYDSGPNPEGRPDAASRQLVADWFRRHDTTLRERVVGFDFSFPSAISRGVLTAILWVAPMPVPITMHESLRRAITSGLSRLPRTPPGGIDAVIDTVQARARAAER